MKSTDLRSKTFTKLNGYGYKIDEIDTFVDLVAKTLEAFENSTAQNKKTILDLQTIVRKFKDDEEANKKSTDAAVAALEKQKKEIDKTIRETGTAFAKAMSLENNARERADEITKVAMAKTRERVGELVENAKKEAADIIEKARVIAENKLIAVEKDVERERETLSSIKQEVADFKKKMYAIYKEHIDIIANLPDYENTETDKNAENVNNVILENTQNLASVKENPEILTAPEPKHETTAQKVEEDVFEFSDIPEELFETEPPAQSASEPVAEVSEAAQVEKIPEVTDVSEPKKPVENLMETQDELLLEIDQLVENSDNNLPPAIFEKKYRKASGSGKFVDLSGFGEDED